MLQRVAQQALARLGDDASRPQNVLRALSVIDDRVVWFVQADRAEACSDVRALGLDRLGRCALDDDKIAFGSAEAAGDARRSLLVGGHGTVVADVLGAWVPAGAPAYESVLAGWLPTDEVAAIGTSAPLGMLVHVSGTRAEAAALAQAVHHEIEPQAEAAWRTELTRTTARFIEASLTAAADQTYESAVQRVLDTMQSFVVCDEYAVFLVDAEAQQMHAAGVRHHQAHATDDTERLVIPRNNGPEWQAVTTKTMICVDNSETEDQLVSALYLPLARGTARDVFAVLALINKHMDKFTSTRTTFTPVDITKFEIIAPLCAIALAHSAVLELLEKARLKQRVQDEIICYHMRAKESAVQVLAKTMPKADISVPLWQWDTFALSEQELAEAALHMFYDLNIVQQYQIDHGTLCRFILTVANGYRPEVQYHNWKHGFTVAHFAYSMIKTLPLNTCLLPHEISALFIAALSHDIDHRGRTNNFMIKQRTPIGMLFNQGGTMERHHLDMTMMLLQDPQLSILANAPVEAHTAVLEHIGVVIMATDLIHHFRSLKDLKSLAQSRSSYDVNDPEQRRRLTSLITTVCDVSGVLKPNPVDRKIADVIYQEFFDQGDEERQLGLTPISMMDRNCVIPKEQLGFLDNVVKDAVVAMHQFFPEIQPILAQFEKNRAMWDADLQKIKLQA